MDFKKPIRLSKRLQAAANYARKGVTAADIGADHAQLTLHLAMQGRTVYACDINPGPLAVAREAVAEAALEDRVMLIQSDGLTDVPTDARDIFILGMGGGLIADILRRGSLFYQDGRFILSPAAHAEVLRRFLYENGFTIMHETPVWENNRLHIVLCAAYVGNEHIAEAEWASAATENEKKKNTAPADDFECLLGRYCITHQPPYTRRMTAALLRREKQKYAGLLQGNVQDGRPQRTAKLIQQLEAFLQTLPGAD